MKISALKTILFILSALFLSLHASIAEETHDSLAGEYPALSAIQGGAHGDNIEETPCRKAPPFSVESFNFWPLFHYTSDPLDRTREVEGLGPFLYWKKDPDRNQWGVRPLLFRLNEPDASHERLEFVYPFGKYEVKGEDQKGYLFPVSVFRDRTFDEKRKWDFQFFPFFIGETETGEGYHGLFPLYGTFLERYGYQRIRFFLWPLYGATDEEGAHKTNWVWPFFSLTQGEKKQGIRFWPLYGKEEKFGVSKKSFLLWPVFMKGTNGLDTEYPMEETTVFPLYISKTSPRMESRTYLWPFITHAQDRLSGFEQWDLPWPFFQTLKGENLYGIRFFPFYGYKVREEDSKRIFILYPLYQYREDYMKETTETTHRFLLLIRIRDEETLHGQPQADSLRIWPFFDYEKEETGHSTFSLLYLFPFKDEGFERNLFPLFRVFRWEKEARGKKSTNILWGFYQRKKSEEFDFWEVAHLIKVQKGKAQKTVSLLEGLFRYHRDGENTDIRLFYIPIPLH